MRFRKPALTLALLVLSAFMAPRLQGQAYTSVSASTVQSGFGVLLTSGIACFQPITTATGAVATITPSGGPASSAPYCGTVTSGAFSFATVPNLATASPSGISYTLAIYNGSGATVLALNGVNVTGSTWTFDGYTVATAAYPSQPSAYGLGTPYLPCTSGGSYTRLNPAQPSQAGWTCTITGGSTIWYQAGGGITPLPPYAAVTIPIVAQMIANSGTTAGVTLVNGINGSVTLLPGANTTITPSGHNITISSTASGGATIAATSSVIKGDGAGNGVAATPGTDYVIPSGNVATATTLASTPTTCPAGQAPRGVIASGNATGCQVIAGGGSFPPAGIPQSTGAAWGTSLPRNGAGAGVVTGPATPAAGDFPVMNADGSLSDSGLHGGLVPQVNTTGLIGEYFFTSAAPYADSSGNENNCVPGAGSAAPIPTQQGLLFDSKNVNSVNEYCELPNAVTSSPANGATYMSYMCQTPMTIATDNGWSNQIFMGSTSTTGVLLHFTGNSQLGFKGVWEPGIGQNVFGGAINFKNTTALDYTGGCHTITWQVGSTGINDRIFIDDNEVSYSAQGSSAATLGIGNLQLGWNNNTFPGVDMGYWGTVRNLFIWNRDLNTSEIQYMSQVARTLGLFGGINYPPTRSSRIDNQISCVGDSITQQPPTGATNSWCSSALFTPTESVSIHNFAVQGKLLAAMSVRSPIEIFPSYSSNGAHNTVSIYGGTNDQVWGAATAYNYGVALANNMHNAGYKVIYFPVMSSQGGFDGYKDTLDTSYNSAWQSFADIYVAPTDPNLYADGASANATYFQGGGPHPTQLGQNLLAGYAVNAYNKLYGSTRLSPNIVSTTPYTLQAADSYVTVTSNSVLTLPNCYGYSGSWTVKVMPTLTVTIANAIAAQTIDGVDYSAVPLSLTAGSSNVFQVQLGAPSVAGCTWIRN